MKLLNADMSKRFIVLEHATLKFNRFLGTSFALICAVGFLLLWAWSRFTDSKWHDMIGDLAAMVGFINLFTMQRAQNKDLKAIHLKLDELIASSESASNRMIKMEEAPEHILDQIHEVYREAALSVKNDPSRATISLDEADEVMKVMHRDLRELDEISEMKDMTERADLRKFADLDAEHNAEHNIDMRPPGEVNPGDVKDERKK
ncbi:MAG: low affinity iron permease family protein [Cyanobacteria bacterium REEB67]|nr:low affinity iron permease family protein [Cyanobacteria bacterium REEB67]